MKSRRSTFSAGIVEDQIYVVGGYNGKWLTLIKKCKQLCNS